MSIQHLRMAYHTSDLDQLISFYTALMDLDVIGSFEDHEGYSDVFLGREGQTWHLEFATASDVEERDEILSAMMVFYHDAPADYRGAREAI